MNLQYFIETYGYAAVVVGTFFEGETVLVLGGIAAQLGYLELPFVILSAFFGTLLGDQLFFFLGRFRGQRFLKKRPQLQPKIEKVSNALHRYGTYLIFAYRYIYGFRSITPFVIGMSSMAAGKFIPLNILAALLWATIIGVLGFLFGEAFKVFLGNIQHYQVAILLTVAVVGIILFAFHYFRNKRRSD